MAPRYTYHDISLAKFLRQCVLGLKPRKFQCDIGAEAGFVDVNMIGLIQSGAAKLPLDRVPGIARRLEMDPRRLLRLALERDGEESGLAAIEHVVGTVVTANEAAWLAALREASENTDPPLTVRSSRSSTHGREDMRQTYGDFMLADERPAHIEAERDWLIVLRSLYPGGVPIPRPRDVQRLQQAFRRTEGKASAG